MATDVLERFPQATDYASRNDLVEAAKAIHDELAAKIDRLVADGIRALKAAAVEDRRLLQTAVEDALDGVQEIISKMPTPVVNVQQPPRGSVTKTITYDVYGKPQTIVENHGV